MANFTTVYYTIAFDLCHLDDLEVHLKVHFCLRCHFHVHFSNLWQAFASRGP